MSCLRYSSASIMKCSVGGQSIANGGKFGLWEADEIDSKLRVSNINERIRIRGNCDCVRQALCCSDFHIAGH